MSVPQTDRGPTLRPLWLPRDVQVRPGPGSHTGVRQSWNRHGFRLLNQLDATFLLRKMDLREIREYKDTDNSSAWMTMVRKPNRQVKSPTFGLRRTFD